MFAILLKASTTINEGNISKLKTNCYNLFLEYYMTTHYGYMKAYKLWANGFFNNLKIFQITVSMCCLWVNKLKK